LGQYTCGGQDVCAAFSDPMELLKSVNSCLTARGLIADLGYPPTSAIGICFINQLNTSFILQAIQRIILPKLYTVNAIAHFPASPPTHFSKNRQIIFMAHTIIALQR
jgi:hypothetical protein